MYVPEGGIPERNEGQEWGVGSLRQERVASGEGRPPSTPELFPEASVFQDCQLRWAVRGGARPS